MHEGKKYRAEDEKVMQMSEMNERSRMALIEFNDDVGSRHPWEVLNTQRSEVKTPYCKVVVYERPF
jgi:hypothetical protein